MRSRLYEIDLFRFLAAMAVLFYHYTFRGNAADAMCDLSFPYLSPIAKYGYLGVAFFFMISGFVILLTASKRDAVGFVRSRITRLYPAFWAAVTLTAVAAFFIGGDRFHVSLSQYVTNLTMLGQQLGVEYTDGVYWSLFVELKFYLLVFVVLLANQIRNAKPLLGVWLALSLFLSMVDAPRVVTALLMPDYAPYFIAGAMFYLIRSEGVSPYKLVVIGGAYCLSLHRTIVVAVEIEQYFSTSISLPIVVGIVSAFYSLFFLTAFGKTGILNRKSMLLLGAITYPLYLIHQHVGFMVFNLFDTTVNKYVLLLSTTGLMILLAWAISRYAEVPGARLLGSLFDRATSKLRLLTPAFPGHDRGSIAAASRKEAE